MLRGALPSLADDRINTDRTATPFDYESLILDASLRQQATIATSATVSGFGFWSGRDVQLTFKPAAVDAGVTFVRTDLPSQPTIPAAIRYRVQGPRRTTLVHNGCAVEMVEHVLAALAGLRIDNCEVHVDRAEMPGCDGSSQAFTNALTNAGRVLQRGQRPQVVVTAPLRVGDDDSWVTANPNADGQYRLRYSLNYPHATVIGAQTFESELNDAAFLNDIAPARTFVLQSEAEALQNQGLGQRVTHQDVLVFDDHGPQDNPLRFENECARHKTLDMIGDFALAGVDLVGDFHANRSGHRLNSQMVFALLSQAAEQTSQRRSA